MQDLGSPVVGYESGKDYSRGTNFTCMATTGAFRLQSSSEQQVTEALLASASPAELVAPF